MLVTEDFRKMRSYIKNRGKSKMFQQRVSTYDKVELNKMFNGGLSLLRNG